MPTLFQYAPEIVTTFPNVVGGVIYVPAVSNGPTPSDLLDQYLEEQRAVIARIGDTPLSEIPALSAWRGAFRTFGVDPTGYRSAAESLLRRLTKKGDIPSINTLVDIGNLVSIRYALPVAVFDMRGVSGGTRVAFASGSESFMPLEAQQVEHPSPGEVVFVDDAGTASARRWCWRQSAASAARADTTRILITVEAHHDAGRADVDAALHDLNSLLDRYAPGNRKTAVVDASSPVFSAVD